MGRLAHAIALTSTATAVLVGVQRLEHTFRQLRRGVHAEDNTPSWTRRAGEARHA
jgi:hypothetical protein